MTEPKPNSPIKIPSNDLAPVLADDGKSFVVHLLKRDESLKTPAGHIVKSDRYELLRHMVDELQEYPLLSMDGGVIVEPRKLSSYLLYSTQRDFVEEGEPLLSREHLEHILESHDPVLQPSAGPEWVYQLNAWESIARFLNSLGTELRPRPKYGKAWSSLIEAVTKRWQRLTPPAQAVANNLYQLFGYNLICAIAVASRACSATEFASAVLNASPLHHNFGFSADGMTSEERHTAAFREARDAARTCLDYMSFYPNEEVALLMERGENTHVEFKSSLRWNLQQDRKDQQMEYECLKTIAAFLNTDGGILLIGVRDDGTPIGIEIDRFDNEDKFLLHLHNKVRAAMGAAVASRIRTGFAAHGGRTVCKVNCEKSPAPVYMRRGASQDGEFYVRNGPSSVRVPPEEQAGYVTQHFKHDFAST